MVKTELHFRRIFSVQLWFYIEVLMSACVYNVSVTSASANQSKRSENDKTTFSGVNTAAAVAGSLLGGVVVALVIVIVILVKKQRCVDTLVFDCLEL